MLALQPQLGHRRDDLCRDDRIRFWTVGPTLIAYRQAKGGVEVLFIERAELDWAGFMERESS